MKLSYFKHALVKNFLALSTLQGVNLILPFVTLPYLTRVLGVSNYGVVVMVYSIMQLLSVVCDYGFNLSATKEISLFRNNTSKINTIFSSILLVKAGLLIILLFILLILVIYVPVLAANKATYFMGFGIVIGQALTPTWLFQGMEKMKYITIVNLVSKSLFTLLIFVFIKNSEDFIFVPLLYSIGFILAGILSLIFAYKEFGVSFYFTKWVNIIEQIKNSTQYFFSRASVALYTSSNNFIVGLVLGEFYAGIFGVAERLFTAMTVIYSPLSDAIYPHMVQKKDLKLFKKVFLSAIIFNFFVSLITIFFSSEIIYFVFGEGYEESAVLLKYFCFLSLIIVPATFIGYPLLGAFGFEKYANYSVVIACIIHVIILVFISSFLSIYLMVLLLIFTQIIVLGIRFIGVSKFLKQQRLYK
ncbi:oligosaccharide flippase family protein [Sabulilitoribacter arenilitoris]|uniref:Oligosaccharide flippase family protein n=1 Tax=Wocania arenilitoris TaxID=2044858 RepID=A0AAE3EK75_9FLAO|nr:oligosaccharide flippase family protein [Wocania arenilitoris]MCF7566773.1 oligosaccharide flippase family protein [Wocania arenilitoris]